MGGEALPLVCPARALIIVMDPFLISTVSVFVAEMGDKTQLLAMLLAARFRQPMPIILGIFVATLLNHAAAGWVGAWLSDALNPEMMRWITGVAFLVAAVWALIPDKMQDAPKTAKASAFLATALAFFLAENGDKTQLATITLAAKYSALLAVVAGTTLGMMLANIPAVLLGRKILDRIPMRLMHSLAALLFAVLGMVTLLS